MTQEIFALIVDDDEPIRSLMKKVLKRARFHVDVARDGVEALDLMERTDYAVILLDLMMPRMSGFDVLQHLTTTAPEKVRRIVVMTAASSAQLAQLEIYPLFATLRKPFDIEELRGVAAHCAQQNSVPADRSGRLLQVLPGSSTIPTK